MFERETKREKILEARHREMRLKEKTKLEGKDEEAKEEVEEEKPQEVLKRVHKEFFDVIEGEVRRRERARAKLKVEQVTVRPVTGSSVGMWGKEAFLSGRCKGYKTKRQERMESLKNVW